jgi:hypothetical protein
MMIIIEEEEVVVVVVEVEVEVAVPRDSGLTERATDQTFGSLFLFNIYTNN